MPEEQAVAGDRTARRWTLVALAAAIFAGAASMRILDALLPNIASFYGVSVGSAGLAVTAYSGSYSLCQIIYGPLGDRAGPYKVVLLAALLSSMAAVGCAIAPSINWLVALRLLAGGVAAAIGPLALTWVSLATRIEQRPVVVANVTGASIIGATTGQVAGGVIGELFSWQASFLFIAMLFAVTALALCWAIVNRPHFATLGRRRPADGGADRLAFKQLLARRAVRITLAGVGVEGLATYMTFTYASALLHQRFTTSAAIVGLLIALFGIGGVIFVLAARPLTAKLSEANRARLGGSLMAGGFLFFGMARSPLAAGAALLILGFGFFMFHNILQVMATKMAPDAMGSAISLFAATFFLSQAAGALIGGWFFDRLGAWASCGISACVLTGLGFAMARHSGGNAA